MSNYQSSETFAWSLLVSNTESESEMFSEFDRVVARKNTQVFLHDKPKTSYTRRIFMNEQQPTSPEKSAAVTDVAFHSTHRNGYQSKLLFFHSKGDRCSLWGLLHCDELPRDRSHDTVMISMNFNSYASLVRSFITPVLSVLFLNTKFSILWQC